MSAVVPVKEVNSKMEDLFAQSHKVTTLPKTSLMQHEDVVIGGY